MTGPIPAVPASAEPLDHTPAPLGIPERTHWVAIVALALGMFTLVTVEQLPIGVLTLMSTDLGVSEGAVGLAVTLPGILAGVVALLVPGATAALNRRTVLVLSLIAVIASCLISALAGSYATMLASRIFTGLAIGMYWPVLPLVAGAQARPENRATAFTIVYAGIGSALVLGLPLATWLGVALGWRGSFGATAALATIALIVVVVLVRPVPAVRPETLRSTFGAARIRGVRYAFVLTLVIITAQFVSYSYISPILQELGGVSVKNTSGILLLYGVLGIVGNFVAGPIIKRSPALAVLVLAGGVSIALILVAAFMNGPVSAFIIVCLWGLFGGMGSVSIQSLVSAEAGEREEAGTALNSAAFNVSIGMGAVIGGGIVDTVGLRPAVWVSVAGMLAGVAIIARFLALVHRRPSVS